jgi:hypothetical protein
MPKRISEVEQIALTARLDGLRCRIADLSRQKEEAGLRLRPVFEKERNLKDRIQATHGAPGSFNYRRAPDRKPLYEALLVIACEHGAEKSAYGTVRRMLKACETEADRIEKVLAK